MKHGCLGLAALALAVASVHPAQAAQIERRQSHDDTFDLITLTGLINPTDDEAFRQIAASTGKAVVILNSEGGSVQAALEIGRAIRLKGFATAVPKDTLCASACALTWLAGTPRFLSASSHVGFHASYVVSNGRASESGVGNALIGAYLNQIGLSGPAIIFVTSAPPEGMRWLTADTAADIGVSFASLDNNNAERPMEPDAPTIPFDPMGTVTTFYNALAAADGDAAAALVIPEKRGIGPFNESSIHSFFGGLAEPLRLQSVASVRSGEVEVSYHYVKSNGETCDGRANVTTVYRFGKTLISKIRALDGC